MFFLLLVVGLVWFGWTEVCYQMLVEARNIREQGWRVAGGLSQAHGSVMNMEIVSAHLHTSLLYPLYEEINHASSTLLNFLPLH